MTFSDSIKSTGITPRKLILRGFLHLPDLTLCLEYESSLWDAIMSWGRMEQQNFEQFDLADPYVRFGIRAMVLHQHELAHFISFINSPFARIIQGLAARRNFNRISLARLLYESGETKLFIPISKWRESYNLDNKTATIATNLEEKANSAEALLNMFILGPIEDSAPSMLNHISKGNNFWWPWNTFYEQVRSNHKKGLLTFRDIFEGYATNVEFCSMGGFGITMDDFLDIRSDIFAQYWKAPNLISNVLKQYREFTVGIALMVAATIPAYAIITEWDEWPLFDAYNCLLVTMNSINKIGAWENSSITINQFLEDAGQYIKNVFNGIQPGFNPSELLSPKNLKKIDEAFGFDEEEWSILENFSPALTIIKNIQKEMHINYNNEWPTRFLPVQPLGIRWDPPLIWFANEIRQFSDINTYHAVRHSFLRAKLAEDLWTSENFDEFIRWSYSGVKGGKKGRNEVLSQYLIQFTGFTLNDIEERD